jgi:hypothetical protein
LEYKSYKPEVMAAMRLCKKEFCVAVGTLAVAEVQPLVKVDTGNLRRSIVSETMPGDEGVYIGANESAPYALTIEKGLSGHKAQPFLEPGAIQAIPKITNVAESLYRSKLGGV